MTFIRTIPAAEATGDVKELYDQNKATDGSLPNYVKVFSHRPEAWKQYGALIGSIRRHMDFRRYELLTTAAALAIRSSYCALAHGQILSDKVLGPEQAKQFARDFRQADLTPAEKAMVAFARKVVLRVDTVSQDDVDELYSHGFGDAEIFDIAAVAMLRSFFSKLIESLGAEPDHFYSKLDPELRDVLTVGRPIEKTPAP